MKGRAAAMPYRAGVTGGLGGIAASDRSAASALRAGRKPHFATLLAAVVLAARCSFVLAQTAAVPP